MNIHWKSIAGSCVASLAVAACGGGETAVFADPTATNGAVMDKSLPARSSLLNRSTIVPGSVGTAAPVQDPSMPAEGEASPTPPSLGTEIDVALAQTPPSADTSDVPAPTSAARRALTLRSAIVTTGSSGSSTNNAVVTSGSLVDPTLPVSNPAPAPTQSDTQAPTTVTSTSTPTVTRSADGTISTSTSTGSTGSTRPVQQTPGANAPKVLLSDAATLGRLRTLLAIQNPAAIRFKQLVDKQIAGGNSWAYEHWYSAMMSQVTQDPKYCQHAVAGTDAYVAAEEALINQNKRAVVAGDSYLQVGNRIGNVALVYDWCRGSMTSAQRTRWVNYANQAVWNVWNPREAKWGNTVYAWSGWGTNNPSNNYYYSFMRATMILGLATRGENPQAQAWLDMFRTTRFENQVVPVFLRDLAGGGSLEGTGYGVAMSSIFRLYDWWHKSTGENIANRTPHAVESLPYMMHSIVPTMNKIAPTGDHSRDSGANLFDSHRDYLMQLIRLYPENQMSGIAKSLLAASSVPQMRNGYMFYADYLLEHSDVPAQPLSRLATAYWASGVGQFSMRSSWTPTATYSNFICGPYKEVHASRDQGSFVIFNGDWLAMDANLVSRSGVQQIEATHNLVRVEQNGQVVKQLLNTPRCVMQALADNPNFTYGLANVAPVYGTKGPVARMEREFLFIKPSTFVVFDRAQTTGTGVQRVWTLNLPVAPTVEGDRISMVRGNSRLDVLRLAPQGVTPRVVSWPAELPDVQSGFRVDVADAMSDSSVFLNVLGVNGSVQEAVRSDAAGQTGTAIRLADGRTVTVRFSTQGSGGSIEIRSPSGGVQVSGALPTTVQAPPLLAN
jgi:hypothetical protein